MVYEKFYILDVDVRSTRERRSLSGGPETLYPVCTGGAAMKAIAISQGK
jgi:hypothetical protein